MEEPVSNAEPRRQLILPVDDSEDALRATRWMLENLYRSGDVVHIIHVVPFSSGMDLGALPVWAGVYESLVMLPEKDDLVKNGLELVKSKFVPLLEDKGAAYKVHVLSHGTDPSSIAEAIAGKATELDAHAIVLAHHKASTLKTWFLGSVCHDMVNRQIQTPLVVVR